MNRQVTNFVPYIVFLSTVLLGVFVLFISYQYASSGVMPEIFQQDYDDDDGCDCAPNCDSDCKPYDPEPHDDDDDDDEPQPWAQCSNLTANKTTVKPGENITFTLTGNSGNTTNNFTAGRYKIGTGTYQNATKSNNTTFTFGYTVPTTATPGTTYAFQGEVQHSVVTGWKAGAQCQETLTVAQYTAGCEKVTVANNITEVEPGQTLALTIKGAATDHPGKYDAGKYTVSVDGGAFPALSNATAVGDGYNFTFNYTVPAAAKDWVEFKGVVHNVALGNLDSNACILRLLLKDEPQEYVCKEIEVNPAPARGTTVSATCKAQETTAGLANKAQFRIINTANNQVVVNPVEKAMTNGVSAVYQYAVPQAASALPDGTYKIQCRVCKDAACTNWGVSSTLSTQ